jgi:uncharacterized protein
MTSKSRNATAEQVGAPVLEPPNEIAFTPSMRAVQARKGSRAGLEKIARRRPWRDRVDDELAAFIAERDSFYLATASADGQPYVQHRGGPKGFLRILDEKTLAFADYTGNRQYITLGNLEENDKAHIFLMDYANRRRVKIWGRARVVEDDPALLDRLMPEGYAAKPEQAIVFTIEEWHANCRQHIPRLFPEADVARVAADLQRRIAELEAENAALRAASNPAH